MFKADFKKCKTNYDIANAAITFFAKAKGQSRGYGSCVYRDFAHDRCCAVGMFIPDTIYHEQMEGNSASYLADFLRGDLHKRQPDPDKVALPDWAPFTEWYAKHIELLAGLQRLHDDEDRWWGLIFNGWGALEYHLFAYPESYTYTPRQREKLAKRINFYRARAERRIRNGRK